MPRVAILFSVLVTAVACDGPVDPFRTANDPVPDRWTMIPIDSNDVTLRGAGISASGMAVGTLYGVLGLGGPPTSAAFRSRNGVLETARLAGSDLSIIAVNDSGDAIGISGQWIGGGIFQPARRAFVWRAKDSQLTPLFAADTALDPVDINNRGDILLAPRGEFYPGAIVLRGTELRRVEAPVAITPLKLTDAGIVVGQVRGEFTDRWIRAASPFDRTVAVPENGARCPWASSTVAVYADHGNDVIAGIYRDGKLAYQVIDNGVTCRSAELVPDFRPTGLNATGWYWSKGTADAFGGDRGIIVRGGTSRSIGTLATGDWTPLNVIGVSAYGDVLATATKKAGYGIGKTGLVILKPR